MASYHGSNPVDICYRYTHRLRIPLENCTFSEYSHMFSFDLPAKPDHLNFELGPITHPLCEMHIVLRLVNKYS